MGLTFPHNHRGAKKTTKYKNLYVINIYMLLTFCTSMVMWKLLTTLFKKQRLETYKNLYDINIYNI